MMDISPTQVYENDDIVSTQILSHSLHHEAGDHEEIQVGILSIGSDTYLIKKGITKIGRHTESNIVLSHQTVSKRHAEIEANSRETTAWICDLNSSNKTKLNNSTLRPGRCYELKDGSILEFGMIRAVYKVHQSVDDSLVPETPELIRQTNLIISGTPDSSWNNSSTLGGNDSIISGTQTENGESLFRRPTVPQRNSTTSNKNSFQESTARTKENVNEQRVSIHDMETQKSSESQNKTNSDIGDHETQKICSGNVKTIEKQFQKKPIDIHGMETQHDKDLEARNNITDIHEVETQHDTDIHDIRTPRKIACQNVSARDSDDNIQGYLQLPPSTNFDNDCSELSKSPNLLGSKNLLEDFIGDDDALYASNSKTLSSTSIKSSCLNNNETTEKSTDDENIFDANTQTKNENENIFETTTQSINSPFTIPLMEYDSDEIDQECMFQRYSRVASQDSQQPSKSQSVVSDDSNTDEEGHFTEIAIKQRLSASLSFDAQRNESKEITSRDSDDLFDVPTQRVNLQSKDSTAMADADLNVAPQVKKSEDNLETEELEIDDMAPTQILQATESSPQINKPIIHSSQNTQIIGDSEKVLESDCSKSSSFSDKLNPISVEECSVEDIDYEMAPTQLISEIDKSKSVSTAGNKKNTPKKSNKINLDDTLEINLNNMFNDVNEGDIEEQPQISTQVLTDMLQLSQYEDKSDTSHKSNSDSKSTTIGKAKKSQRHGRRKTSVIDSTSHSTPNKQYSKSRNEKSKMPETILGGIDLLKNNKDESEESFRIGDQVSAISIDTKQFRQTSILLEEDDDDILVGLPQVKISGTLSNPASPTSSISTDFRLDTNRIRSKWSQKKAEPKKKPAPKKSTRRSVARGNMKNAEPYHSIRKSNSSTILESFGNFKVDKVSTNEHESDDENLTERSKQSVKKTPSKNLRKTKESRSLLQRKSISPINTREQARHSPSIQNNGRVYNSSKKNVDRSSVFQVGTKVLVEDIAIKPAKKTGLSSSRVGKRSLSTTDVIESNNTKKLKKDINESTSSTTERRKRTAKNTTVNKRNSTNIFDYMTERNSPVNLKNSCNTQLSFSQESLQSKQLVIKIMKMSPTSSTEWISRSTLAQSMAKNIVNNKTKQTRGTSVNNLIVSNDSATTESEKAVPNIEARRNRSQRATNKCQLKEEVVSSQGGEESQEVEMIMNVSLKEQNTSLNTEKKKDKHERTRNVKIRNTRKRANTILPAQENSEECSASSDITESDNSRLEMPISKPKRAKLSKSSSNIANTSAKELATKTKRNSRQLSKSTRSLQKSLSDNSMEEYSETDANQNSVNNIANNASNTNKRRRKAEVQNLEADKKQSKHLIENSTFSETNSSVDNISIFSTPTRARRSASSSFSTSSPFKIKHRILFTGIANNDYSKLLKKLGASQVEDPAKCSVLVTDKVRRTVKFLCALAQSVPIVSINWLVESEKAGHFMELKNYILKDPVAEAKFGFKLRGSLEKAKQQKLLEGYTVIITPNVAPPPLPELKSIISSCGGKPLVRPPSSWPQKTVIISREEDLANAKKFLVKAPKTVTIQSTEFILTGILRQELNFIKHKLT